MNIIKFIFLATTLVAASAAAAPGAHGPNGEHLDAPGGGGHVHSDAGPRIETFSESFELVGHLQEDELSILIDRYETNVPVLNAKLEIEMDGLKTEAKFHDDHGDYAVADEKFLQALRKPGKHSLIFTLTTSEESDLLEGTLDAGAGAAAHDHDDEHGHSKRPWLVTAAVLALLLIGTVFFKLRRTSANRK